MSSKTDLDTLLQHAGKSHRVGSGLVGATENSVTFFTSGDTDPPIYSRLGNTANHAEVETLLASLHGSEAALVLNSGMAAITNVFMAFSEPGCHVLVQENCYGGTFGLIQVLQKKLAVEFEFAAIKDWPKRLRANTKLCFFESISNPFCIPADFSFLAAHIKHNPTASPILVCDNTFASPALCRPLALGCDLVIESATKYMNGHSDVVAGMIAGSTANIHTVREQSKFLGTYLAPHFCALLIRGLKTLRLRMDAHSANGQRFAAGVRAIPETKRVFYGPDDQASAQNDSATNVANAFAGGYGGMCSVLFHDHVPVASLLRELKLFSNVPSLGGTESTVTTPCYTTNRWLTAAEQLQLGITPQLVRFSIGLENADDLLEDIKQAIGRVCPKYC